jgi:integrase/recombinase XerC
MEKFAYLPDSADILWPERDKALIMVMYSAGLRVSEAASLTLSGVDGDHTYARVLGKGNKERLVFFSDEAKDALEEYLAVRDTKLMPGVRCSALFLSQRGAPLSTDGIRWIIGRYSRVSELGKNIHPHSLRHSFATHLMNGGADVRIVQELLGHTSIAATQRYTHVNIERLKNVYRSARGR